MARLIPECQPTGCPQSGISRQSGQGTPAGNLKPGPPGEFSWSIRLKPNQILARFVPLNTGVKNEICKNMPRFSYMQKRFSRWYPKCIRKWKQCPQFPSPNGKTRPQANRFKKNRSARSETQTSGDMSVRPQEPIVPKTYFTMQSIRFCGHPFSKRFSKHGLFQGPSPTAA